MMKSVSREEPIERSLIRQTIGMFVQNSIFSKK